MIILYTDHCKKKKKKERVDTENTEALHGSAKKIP